MHLWQLEKWTKYYDSCDCRKGLRVHYEPPVNQRIINKPTQHILIVTPSRPQIQIRPNGKR